MARAPAGPNGRHAGMESVVEQGGRPSRPPDVRVVAPQGVHASLVNSALARPVDLDVASDQSAWPVRVSRSLDTEAVRGPGLAAVVDVNGEGLRRRAGRPDDRGRTTERGVLASGCRRTGRARATDRQPIKGLGLDPYVRLMVVVLQVPCCGAALHHEAERSLGPGIGQAWNQRGQRQEHAVDRKNGVALDLAPAGHLPGSGGYAAEACPTRGRRDEPRGVVDAGGNPGACSRTDWAWPVGRIPPVASTVDDAVRKRHDEGRVNCDPMRCHGDVEVVLVNRCRPKGWIVFEPDGNGVTWCDQVADVVTHDKNVGSVSLQPDSMCPAATDQVADRVVPYRDCCEAGGGRSGAGSIVDMNRICAPVHAMYVRDCISFDQDVQACI